MMRTIDQGIEHWRKWLAGSTEELTTEARSPEVFLYLYKQLLALREGGWSEYGTYALIGGTIVLVSAWEQMDAAEREQLRSVFDGEGLIEPGS